MQIEEINQMLVECQELENQLVAMKKIEERQKELKTKIQDAMEIAGVDKWETPNGIKISLVRGWLPSESKQMKFDEGLFKIEQSELYHKYCREVVVKDNGKKSYIRITYGGKNV